MIFWKEYSRDGKIIKEYNFPSDMCWKINGAWEHHYFYDAENRLVEHKIFGGKEGQARTFFRNYFYSYPYSDEPNKANELDILYNYKAKTTIEQEQIDTFYLDTINTKGMFTFFKTSWKFDTIRFEKGNLIFKTGFERKKDLFTPELLLSLINKDEVKDFEIALKNNIIKLSNSLKKIYETRTSHSYEFIFQEANKKREIQIYKTENFIDIKYSFINRRGDNYLTYVYQYTINGNILKKLNFVKSYIEYFK